MQHFSQEDYSQNYALPESAKKIIPQELADPFFQSLDQSLQRQEQQQMERLLGFQESRGLLRSGDTNKQLVEQVLGPGLERRRQALVPFAFEAASKGQEQGFQKELSEMQQKQRLEIQRADFFNQLETMRNEAAMKGDLMRLQNAMDNNFGNNLKSSLAKGLGGAFGQSFGKEMGEGSGKGVKQGLSSLLSGMG